MHARIIGTGHYLPERVLTNTELEQFVDTTDRWIQERTGIRERRIAAEGQTTGDLAEQAARRALEAADIDPATIDLLVVGTTTPDVVFPSTACLIQQRLGLGECGAFDVNAACSGFIYALSVATQFIEAGTIKRALVIGAETLSRLLDWDDRSTCVLFGDGAGAAVLTATDDPAKGCLHQSMHSDGSRWQVLYLPQTPEDLPEASNGFSGAYNTLQMNGREVYKFAVTTLQACIDKTLQACDLKPDDLAVIIPHQSNSRILESAREKLGLSRDRLYINIDRYGNTSAASVPICLHELCSEKRLKPGDLVLFVALGGGLTWSSSLWRL